MPNPSVESVTSRFETASGLRGDRSDQLFMEAMRDADKLSPLDQQKVLTSLVEKGYLPEVSIGLGVVRDGSGANPMAMHEKSNHGNPRNFVERLAREMSTSTDLVNRARDLITQRKDGDYPQKMATAADVANAQRQMKSLQEKAGPDAQTGLSKKNLEDLLKRTDLTPGERKAADFLLKNHDKLGETWEGLQIGEKRIKPSGLAKYAKSELGVDGEKVDTADRNKIKQDVIKDSEMKIHPGDSYWRLAQRNLPKDATAGQILEETQRLQKLNGNKPLYAGHSIVTRNNDDIDKEVQRRRAA